MDIVIVISIFIVLMFEYSRYIDRYRNSQKVNVSIQPNRKCTYNEKYFSFIKPNLEPDLETEYEITREWITDSHTRVFEIYLAGQYNVLAADYIKIKQD